MANLQNTSYLFGSNAVFIEELYGLYSKNPESVDPEWRSFFSSLGDNAQDILTSLNGASWRPNHNRIIGFVDKKEIAQQKAKTPSVAASAQDLGNAVKATNLINAYRTYGHMYVNLDPLGIVKPQYNAQLDFKTHGFSEEDLEQEVYIGGAFGVERAPLKDLYYVLNSTYSARIGAEFMHVENPEERSWFQRKLEATAGTVSITNEEKLTALQDVMEAEQFENYLHVKFPGTKRFSVEGGENLISALEVIVRNSAEGGVREFVLGMAHRGRLNTLTKVMGKPYHAMFSEFKGELPYPDYMEIPGDVKYHLGNSSDRQVNGQHIHLSLTPNPSHLEVVNAVVLGKVRAKQDMSGDKERAQVLGILIHGDAAFAGQGSVMEALSLSQLEAYHTGGTLHVVVNNQIGFTTNPKDSRSSTYCSDIAKFISAPILHVNGDDAEAVVYAAKLASEYRSLFKKDIVLDIVCYRKYGHNEGDEPFFTQPIMYNIIKSKKNPADSYAEHLIGSGLITAQDYQARKEKFKNFLDTEFAIAQDYKPAKADWLEGNWSQLKQSQARREEVETGVKSKTLKELGKKLCEVPQDFSVNPKIARQLEAKHLMIESGQGIDWGTGEALAYATLLNENYSIRMTGQDVRRGTFSHRHAVLVDQHNEKNYLPLNNLTAKQSAHLEIHNSNLSEFAVMAFEYGYSITNPMMLTIWEAQFGDFANGAQVIIDQYVASGEAKWLRMSGLVLLLPHGYEGQGPEHSSARLERFLQLCARDNMQVVNCTTPASFYHVLRRQMHRNFRKPLVVMSPKSLLRHKLVASSLSDVAEGTRFKPVIGETEKLVADAKVRKVIICSGKVYYDLLEKREQLKVNDVAIIRLEQIYPFPKFSLADELQKYANAEVVWCQEEHENMGAYYFVEPRIEKVLATINHKAKRAKYCGRMRSASPAVGYMKLHLNELAKFLEEAFKI